MGDTYIVKVFVYQASCRQCSYSLYSVIEISEPNCDMRGSCIWIPILGEE